VLTETPSIINILFAAGVCTAVRSFDLSAHGADPVYAAVILPSRSFRVCIKGRTAIGPLGDCLANRGPCFRDCDVKMGSFGDFGTSRFRYSSLRFLSHRERSQREKPAVGALCLSAPNNIRSRPHLSQQPCNVGKIRPFKSVSLISCALTARCYDQRCLLVSQSRVRVGDCGGIICFANSFSNKVTRRSGRNPRQRGGTVRIDPGCLIEKIIEGVRHSVECIRTIENDDIRQRVRVLSVFVFAIHSTLVRCASLAGMRP
jgi:hypothetical protein